MNDTYTIILDDGTKLENLHTNGNNFIADYEITEDIFKFNLGTVIIEKDGIAKFSNSLIIPGEYRNMQLVSIQHDLDYMNPGEYWFILEPIPESELQYAKLQSKIAYLGMMTDVEFE